MAHSPAAIQASDSIEQDHALVANHLPSNSRFLHGLHQTGKTKKVYRLPKSLSDNSSFSSSFSAKLINCQNKMTRVYSALLIN
jgi:hypothetical protein